MLNICNDIFLITAIKSAEGIQQDAAGCWLCSRACRAAGRQRAVCAGGAAAPGRRARSARVPTAHMPMRGRSASSADTMQIVADEGRSGRPTRRRRGAAGQPRVAYTRDVYFY